LDQHCDGEAERHSVGDRDRLPCWQHLLLAVAAHVEVNDGVANLDGADTAAAHFLDDAAALDAEDGGVRQRVKTAAVVSV
jgi:hypothetical protein